MTKAQNSKKHYNRGLERKKLQDIKLISQRLNHSTSLDTKNDYKKGVGLNLPGHSEAYFKMKYPIPKLNFLCFRFLELFFKANRAFLPLCAMHCINHVFQQYPVV